MRIATFAEFWPYYVREHSLAGTRSLHFIGSTAALGCFVGALITGRWALLLLGLIIGYAFAWTGHFFIEHNKPATFKYPLWSFAADWRMWSLILRGKMDAEVTRVGATKA
jgi:hypothetical protein